AEAAGAEAKHLGVQKLRLPRFTDFVEQEVPAVAADLLAREREVLDPREAAVFPRAETAAHRAHVRVAHFLQDAAGQQRAYAALAVRDDRRLLVGHVTFDQIGR